MKLNASDRARPLSSIILQQSFENLDHKRRIENKEQDRCNILRARQESVKLFQQFLQEHQLTFLQPIPSQQRIESSKFKNEKEFYFFIKTTPVENLNLEHHIHIPNSILKYIGNYCIHLKILNLQNCTQLKDDTLIHIANGCPHIEALHLGNCYKLKSNHSLDTIFIRCFNLKILNLNHTQFTHLCNIKYCKKLQILDLSYCEPLHNLSFLNISEYCNDLIHLDLTQTLINDSSLVSICQHCELLQSLRLYQCFKLTNDSLCNITKFATALTMLDLSALSNTVQDVTIISIAQYGNALQFLSLNHCAMITDASVRAISQHCKRIQVLELVRDGLITLQCLLECVHHCSQLEKLNISEMNLSQEEIKLLQQANYKMILIKHESIIPLQQFKTTLFVK